MELVGSFIVTEKENGEKEYTPNLQDTAMAEREALKNAEVNKAESDNSESGGDNA